MNQFHQFATYFAVIIGSLGVIGVCVYAAIRCFRNRMRLAGLGFLALIPCWFLAHVPLPIILWVIATPNPATPTNLAEHAVAPVYLLIAGFVCYIVLTAVREVIRTKDEASDLSEYANFRSDSKEWLLRLKNGIRSVPAKLIDHKKKIIGLVFVAIGAAGMSVWFLSAGVLFIVVGVSLIMDVRIWQR